MGEGDLWYIEGIKTAVTEAFDSLNASCLDALCEELYAELFEGAGGQ